MTSVVPSKKKKTKRKKKMMMKKKKIWNLSGLVTHMPTASSYSTACMGCYRKHR